MGASLQIISGVAPAGVRIAMRWSLIGFFAQSSDQAPIRPNVLIASAAVSARADEEDTIPAMIILAGVIQRLRLGLPTSSLIGRGYA
jgi:hypothetical protein